MRSACAELWCNDVDEDEEHSGLRSPYRQCLQVPPALLSRPISAMQVPSPAAQTAFLSPALHPQVTSGSSSPLCIYSSDTWPIRINAHALVLGLPTSLQSIPTLAHSHVLLNPILVSCSPGFSFTRLACCFGVTPRQTLSCPNEIYFQTLSVAC